MKTLDKVLGEIDQIISEYESGIFISQEKLHKAQRLLSSNIYYLTKENIEAFQRWNNLVYNYEGSNAKAVTYADNKIPELRITRKILEACKSVSIAMNSELKHN